MSEFTIDCSKTSSCPDVIIFFHIPVGKGIECELRYDIRQVMVLKTFVKCPKGIEVISSNFQMVYVQYQVPINIEIEDATPAELDVLYPG